MKSEQLKLGDKYTFISPNPRATVYNQWTVCEVVKEESKTMGYWSEEKGIYILHNEDGPCFQLMPEMECYFLNGIEMPEPDLKRLLRRKKLERILNNSNE